VGRGDVKEGGGKKTKMYHFIEEKRGSIGVGFCGLDGQKW
jgi:hypothetical protein